MMVEHCETCPYHMSEVQRTDGLKDRVIALEKCNVDLKKELGALDKKLILISNDLGYIKKPLGVMAIAMVIYVVGALFNLMPYASLAGG